MLHFIIGGAGCGKSYRIMEFIKSIVYEGKEVLTLVPEQFSYEFDRKLYGHIGAKSFNSIETHSFTSLARDIFRRFGGGEAGSYMDELMQTGLILKAIGKSKGQLNFFEKQTGRGEFASEAASIISVLRRSGITSEQLMMKCQNLKGKLTDKTADIALVYQYYEMLLTEHNLKDMLTDITESAAIANGNDFFAGKTVFIDEFESFTPDQYEMLNVIIGLADDVYIALRMESENEHELSLFASVGAACRKIKRIAEEHDVKAEFTLCKVQHRQKYECIQRLSETIFRPGISEPCGKAEHIHIFEAATPSDESEYVCATIKRILAERQDIKCRDIAVVTNELPVYEGTLRHSMKRYGLPCHIDISMSLMYTPFMVYLTALTALISRRTPDTELLLRCGKSGFTDLSLTELAELENYCYIWRIDGEMWLNSFEYGKDAAYTDVLREKLISPFLILRELCSNCETGSDYSRTVYEFLTQENIGERFTKMLSGDNDGTDIQMKQDFKRVWDSLADILDVLAFLYDEQKCTAGEYFSMLDSMLMTVSHSVPPRTLDAVFIGPAGTSRLSDPKITFVIGACDGVFPMNPGGSSIFSEKDRLELLKCGIEIGQAPELNAADERLAVYKILSSPSEELYLCYSLKDSSDKKRLRSSAVSHALSLFTNKNEMLVLQSDLGASYYAVTKAAAYYHYVQNFSKRNSDIAAIQTVLYEDKYYAERINYLKSVHDDVNFAVDPIIMEKLEGSSLILSASQIESYNMCPFQYFCRYALRLFERRRAALSDAERGTLIHTCLEKLLRSMPRESFLKIPAEELFKTVREISCKLRSEAFGGDICRNEREDAAFEHITSGLSAFVLHLQEELSQSCFYPEFIEADISDKSIDFPSPGLLTDSGHIVRIRGKADRIDLFRSDDGNWVRIVDYKTGGKNFSLGNLAYGIDMQMLLYLFAVTSEGSRLYGSHPAGVLYLPSGVPECTLERGSIKTADDAIREQYKMNGILIDDKRIVSAMDNGVSGKYITASLVKSGIAFNKKSGIFLSEQQFEGLRRYTENKLKETADSIYSGDVKADPLKISGRDSCAFCNYRDICGNGDNHRFREPEGTASELKEQVMKEINKGGE